MIARIQKSMKEQDQGFTLIELLVVMIIIGILAAIAVPVYLNQRKKAVDVSLKSDMKTFAMYVETNAMESQTYPADNLTIRSGDVAAPISLSKGNVLTYQRARDGFCILGWNGRSTTQDYLAAYWYSSRGGGLLPGRPSGIPPPAHDPEPDPR